MKNKKLSNKNYIDLGIGGLATGFGGMLYNRDYENRKVMRYGKDDEDLVIDTAYTPDTGYYETGIIDKRYGTDDWIIVEEYETKKEALKGHNRWVKLMTGEKIPKELESVHEEGIFKLNEKYG